MRGWTSAFLCCIVGMLALLVHDVGGQTPQGSKKTPAKITKTQPPAAKTPTPAGPSTLSGVYTNEQAKRGSYVYIGTCRYCHSPQSHTGPTFAKWWRGKQLSELYSFVLTQMPKNDPGSLAAEDVADVVAYLLKMNAMPVGKDELYPDADSLKKFKIEVKSKSATSTAKGAKP